MDRNTPTLSKPLRGAYNLLLVSVVGIASCSICILIYHFLLVKYLKWRRRNNNNIVPPLHTLADTSVNGVDQFYGIDQKLLESIPIIIYSVNNRCAFCLVQTECAVCLGELEEVDRVRVLPGCRHVFHVTCIDEWLKGHVNCPLCRSPLDGPVADIFIDLPIEVIGGDDVASDDTETPHNLMIRHCTSMVLSRESEEIEFFEGKFKRSVSMDQLTVTHAEKRSLELV